MNKNSNKYTIIYTIVTVVIVGALLAILATALKPAQEENILNEQKSSIMKAFGDENGNFDDVKVYLLEKDGDWKEQKDSDIEKVFATISNRKDLAALEDNLPFFEYTRKTKDGEETLYVVPLVGKGLWGDIWGYVSLMNGDKGWEVTGIVMDHAGETPGLGAEIATENVQKQFVGKRIFDGGEFALKMLKNGKDNKEYIEGCSVDAISGGTKTCDGVNAMLQNTLEKYESLF
jgi:Na+-transporting NADH:ubiquinone oxidoreductase subunit C